MRSTIKRGLVWAGAWMLMGAAQAVVIGDGGQASYSHAIAVPAGLGGMEPKLSLVYNSGGINGPAGMGWAIQGLSQITRCPVSNKLDGRVPVRYEANDKLCLDGQRLIQSNAASSADAGSASANQSGDAGPVAGGYREFRSEVDGFNRIRAWGSVNGAPAGFVVHAKAGLKSEYGALEGGGADDARVTAVGGAKNGTPTVWLLKRVSDRYGNYLQFEYAQDKVAYGTGPNGAASIGGEWRLVKALYNASADKAPSKSVEFDYDSNRADGSEAYHMGAKVVQTQLLRTVRVVSEGVTLRRYKLEHQASVATGRSLLKKIYECTGDGSRCALPTQFDYSAEGASILMEKVGAVAGITADDLVGGSGEIKILTADFNGDGRADILRIHNKDVNDQRLYFAGGTSKLSFSRANSFNLNGQVLGGNGVNTFVSDINGDGIADVVRVCSAMAATVCPNLTVWLGKGDGSFVAVDPSKFSTVDVSVVEEPFVSKDIFDMGPGQMVPPAYSLSSSRQVIFKDLDGDGFVDILVIAYQGCRPMRLRCPSPESAKASFFKGVIGGGFVKSNFPTSDGSPAGDWMSMVSPFAGGSTNYPSLDTSDYDGDGLPDAIASGKFVMSLGGRSLFERASSQPAVDGAGSRGLLVLDINGDGKPDFIATSDSANGKDLGSTLWINQGDGTFVPDTRPIGLLLMAGGFRFGGGAFGSMQLDLNGDGLPDFVSWTDQGATNVWMAKRDANVNSGGLSYVRRDYTGPSMGNVIFVGDFLGTGEVSILEVAGSTVNLYKRGLSLPLRNADAPPDLLVQETTPKGAWTVIKYQSLNQASDSPVYRSYHVVNDTPQNFDASQSNAVVDVNGPIWVVSGTSQSNGVQAGSSIGTAFLYEGMKATKERGNLGFARVTKLYPYANGTLMATSTEYHQDPLQFQYLGLAKSVTNYVGSAKYDGDQVAGFACTLKYDRPTPGYVCEDTGVPVKSVSSFNAVATQAALKPVSSSQYVYCELQTSLTAGQGADGNSPACSAAGNLRIRRPYQAYSVDKSWELDGTLVSTTETRNQEMSPFGDVVRSSARITANTAVGGAIGWWSEKGTANEYLTADVNSWTLGRLKKSTVTSQQNAPAPMRDNAPGLELSNSGKSGMTDPPAAPKPMNPAVLSAILQLLLED